MRRGSIRVVVSAMVGVLVLGALPLAQVAKPYGAATPQEAVAALKKATTASDFVGALPLFAPESMKGLAGDGVTGLLMALAFSDPSDPMPGGPTLSKAQMDARKKQYADAVTLAKQTLKPYGLDTLVGKPVLAADTQKAIEGVVARADNVALTAALFGALEKVGPMLGMTKDDKPDPIMQVGNVTGYKITGDTATAQDGSTPIHFVRVDGRWYLTPPASSSSSSGSSAATPAPAAAPAGQRGAAAASQAPAARPAAAGSQPDIVVGGIQIAKVVLSNDDFSSKPFHADNGTRLVLWVKMPAGQGLIELDEDTSVLRHFGDDKGTDLGGQFGAFPEEFKDGSGGIMEIVSTGVPAQGATSLAAEGTVTATVATGTRKTRAANVKLQNDQKFSLGQTSITVADVATEGENQNFTLKLPRPVMNGIKDVAFLDAKGQPLEGHQTSSGYANNNAEMEFTVKTDAHTVTLEFEQWQGTKTIKVPFSVKAGFGLN